MKKKIIISIVATVLLIIGGFLVYGYLGGYPVGFQNGRFIIRQYFCSDVCPQYGGWHDEYFGVNKKKVVNKSEAVLLLIQLGVVLLVVPRGNIFL